MNDKSRNKATKQFKLSDKSIASIIEASPIGMLLVNKDGQVVFVNKKAEDIFCYDKEEFLQLKIEDLIPSRFRQQHKKLRTDFANNPTSRPMGINRLLYGVARGGRELPVEVGLSPLELEGEAIYLVSLIDVTERQRLEQLEEKNRNLTVAANFDALTALPNRRSFYALFNKALQDAAARKGSLILMYIDLDGFKEVNDTHGHEVGDLLLIKIGVLLRANLRSHDIIARIGGDEFIVCMGQAQEIDKQAATTVTNKLIEKITSITNIGDCVISIGASVGILRTQASDGLPIDQVLRRADQLMYEAKGTGKACWVYREI